MDTKPWLSVVVPFYEEAACIETLYARLTDVLRALDRPYELVFVNDGSTDRTPEVLNALYETDPQVTVIHLTTNFGQTAALAAGFDAARGDIIISMDGDLQHSPEDIPRFLAKLDEGYDVVSGWRQKRVDNVLLRKFPSLVANWLIRKLSGVPIHDFGTTFRAYQCEAVKRLELYGELHRFIPALAATSGMAIVEIPITNIIRETGHSKYGIWRVKKVFFDLITVTFLGTFLQKPLQFFGPLGALFMAAGTGVAGLLTCLYFLGRIEMREHLGNLLFAVLLILLGLNFLTTGILAEISARIYFKVSNKRSYVIRKICAHTTP